MRQHAVRSKNANFEDVDIESELNEMDKISAKEAAAERKAKSMKKDEDK